MTRIRTSGATSGTPGGPGATLPLAESDITNLEDDLAAREVIGSDEWLKAMTNTQAFALISATRDANEAITVGSAVWPDGTAGVFTTDTASSTFLGAIDAYHITYLGAITKIVTQPIVTRDAGGGVIAQPVLVVT